MKYYILIFFILLFGCTERTYYTGSLFSQELDNLSKINKKEEFIEKLGPPNYSDPIENKIIYYSETQKFKNFYKQSIDQRFILVLEFDEKDSLINIDNYNLNDENEIVLNNDKTKNNIIKRGFLERVFGGVGTTQIPSSF